MYVGGFYVYRKNSIEKFVDGDITYSEFVDSIKGKNTSIKVEVGNYIRSYNNYYDYEKKQLFLKKYETRIFKLLLNAKISYDEYEELHDQSYLKDYSLSFNMDSLIKSGNFFKFPLVKECINIYTRIISGNIRKEEYFEFLNSHSLPYKFYRLVITRYDKHINDGHKTMDDDFIYKFFMDYFNKGLESDTSPLMLYGAATGFNSSYYDIITQFISSYEFYALQKYQIKDFKKYVLNSKLFKDLYQFHLVLCEDSSAYDFKKKFNEFENKYKIDFTSFKNLVYLYLSNVLGIHDRSAVEYYNYHAIHYDADFYKGRLNESETYKVLSLITNEEDMDKSFSLFCTAFYDKEKGVKEFNGIKSSVYHYILNKTKAEGINAYDYQLEKLLLDKLRLIYNMFIGVNTDIDCLSVDNITILKSELEKLALSKKKAEDQKKKIITDEEKEEAENIIRDAILSYKTISDYLEMKGISRTRFDNMLAIVSEFNPDLYSQYITYSKENSDRYLHTVKESSKAVIDGLTKGIVNPDTNVKRDFDVLDYYEITKGMDPGIFLDYVQKQMNKNSYITAVRFFKSKHINYKSNVKSITSPNYSITIGDRALTGEDKDKIINYLDKISAPVNDYFVTIAFKRYVKGTLNLDESRKMN